MCSLGFLQNTSCMRQNNRWKYPTTITHSGGAWRRRAGLWGNRRTGRRRPDRNPLRRSWIWGLNGGWIPPFPASPAPIPRTAALRRQMPSSCLPAALNRRFPYSAYMPINHPIFQYFISFLNYACSIRWS